MKIIEAYRCVYVPCPYLLDMTAENCLCFGLVMYFKLATCLYERIALHALATSMFEFELRRSTFIVAVGFPFRYFTSELPFLFCSVQ